MFSPMKRYHLLLCFLLYSLSSFSQGWKRIGDDTYSLEVPSGWYTKAVDKNAVRTSEWAAKQGLPRKVTLYEKHNLQV